MSFCQYAFKPSETSTLGLFSGLNDPIYIKTPHDSIWYAPFYLVTIGSQPGVCGAMTLFLGHLYSTHEIQSPCLLNSALTEFHRPTNTDGSIVDDKDQLVCMSLTRYSYGGIPLFRLKLTRRERVQQICQATLDQRYNLKSFTPPENALTITWHWFLT